jgi:hypothetical protein
VLLPEKDDTFLRFGVRTLDMKASSPTGDITQGALLERASARLRTAMALFEIGVALKRAQLRRQDCGQ